MAIEAMSHWAAIPDAEPGRGTPNLAEACEKVLGIRATNWKPGGRWRRDSLAVRISRGIERFDASH